MMRALFVGLGIVARMDLITLADLPQLGGSDPKPRVTIAIGRLDDNLRDPRYGKFAITQKQVDGWKRNLSDTFGGQVAIDFDHSSDRGSGTRAAAWIKSIDQTGKLITADVEFSKRGARAVRNGDYKYTSPTFVENYTDEHGDKHGPALIGAALTNRPVLRKGMPCLSLSADPIEGVAVPREKAKAARKHARKLLASNTEPARDSRPQMSKLKDLAKQLGLDENADHATVLAAVTALDPDAAAKAAKDAKQAKADKKARKLARKNGESAVTLSDDGTVALSAGGYADLLTKANAGQAAAVQLAEQTFNTAWTKALSEGRAAPSQEETVKALFAKDADLAIKTLDSFVKIVPTKAAGSGEGAAVEAPNGMDQDRFELHTEAKALAAEKRKADPKLDEADAYSLAAIEIEERNFTLANPGI